jgi:hypothetical protein
MIVAPGFRLGLLVNHPQAPGGSPGAPGVKANRHMCAVLQHVCKYQTRAGVAGFNMLSQQPSPAVATAPGPLLNMLAEDHDELGNDLLVAASNITLLKWIILKIVQSIPLEGIVLQQLPAACANCVVVRIIRMVGWPATKVGSLAETVPGFRLPATMTSNGSNGRR